MNPFSNEADDTAWNDDEIIDVEAWVLAQILGVDHASDAGDCPAPLVSSAAAVVAPPAQLKMYSFFFEVFA